MAPNLKILFLLSAISLVMTSPILHAQTEPKLAGVPELLAMPEPAADFRFQYGEDPLQFVDLRLPPGDGPFPVAVLVHGGCWMAEYDVKHLGAMAEALTDSGIATWTLEFRRIGNEGGGWPGTFLDVARGVDLLRDKAADHALDLERVVVAGHSAGGHLALWLAGRHKLPADSPLYLPDPLPLKGVIGLAPAADLELTYRNKTCGESAERLIGGTPEAFPERYREGSPAALLPFGIPQLIINGAHDKGWLIVSRAYQERARELGEEVRLIVPPEAGHFELVMPMSATFPLVRAEIEAMLE